MAAVRFKHCAHCGTVRAWYHQACPDCDATEFEITERKGEELLTDAIGDSVTHPLLFETEAPMVAFTDDGRLARVIPDTIQHRLADVTVNILHNQVADYLTPDEQPHFILKSRDPIKHEKNAEVRQIAPSGNFNTSRIIVTDERVILLVPQKQGDVVRTCPYSEITNVNAESGLLTVTLSIETEQATYEIPACEPHQEVDPTIAYIRAQTDDSARSNTAWTEQDYEHAKGATRNERVREAFSDVNLVEVLSYGMTGAKFGSRFGPKGTAVSFVIGTGYGIWDNLSDEASSAEAPDPEHMASEVKRWQQSGAQTGDERIEWLAASAGAAVSIAQQSTDHQTAQMIESIDPELIVGALELGSATLENTSGDLIPSESNLDTLPPIETIREPASEIASVTSQLLEAGLFEELTDTDGTFD